MTDDGSLFDEDGECVTSVLNGQDETADDQLERATNLVQTSDFSVYELPEPETVMTLTDWWDLRIKGQLIRSLRNGDDLAFVTLPSYSPEMNPVEECWRQLQTALSNRFFGSIDELTTAIDTALQQLSVLNVRNYF